MWWRPERFGAWVRFDDGSIVGVDHELRGRLGLDPEQHPAEVTLPLEAHVAVTQRCDAGCASCYQGATPTGAEPPLEKLRATLRSVAALRVSTVAFGGGEPTMRSDLGEVARTARDLGLVPVTTTNGRRIDASRARELRAFAQINVSHDGVAGAYGRIRGHDGAIAAERAISELSAAGIHVGVNVVLAADALEQVEATVDRVMRLGAEEVQLLRFKPSGRAAQNYGGNALGPGRSSELFSLVRRLSGIPGLSVRVDCALVPLLSEGLATMPDAAQALSRLGVFGCEAGRHLVGVAIDGSLMPCSCWGASGADCGGWVCDPELQSMRAWHEALGAPCDECPVRDACRGGCQVVSRFVLGRKGPDPECPRVRMHAVADLSARAG
ncbi:MAG: radical SAM protein [Deltaproteobacteria bacterium]|nr:radical SAM protein [Deltaproteobacteria bacterium]